MILEVIYKFCNNYNTNIYTNSNVNFKSVYIKITIVYFYNY